MRKLISAWLWVVIPADNILIWNIHIIGPSKLLDKAFAEHPTDKSGFSYRFRNATLHITADPQDTALQKSRSRLKFYFSKTHLH